MEPKFLVGLWTVLRGTWWVLHQLPFLLHPLPQAHWHPFWLWELSGLPLRPRPSWPFLGTGACGGWAGWARTVLLVVVPLGQEGGANSPGPSAKVGLQPSHFGRAPELPPPRWAREKGGLLTGSRKASWRRAGASAPDALGPRAHLAVLLPGGHLLPGLPPGGRTHCTACLWSTVSGFPA